MIPEIVLKEYSHVRVLPTGEIAGIRNMFVTTGLFVGLDETGYRTRFCYDGINQEADAIVALAVWDGSGFPPGYWIKQKGDVDITNPQRVHEEHQNNRQGRR